MWCCVAGVEQELHLGLVHLQQLCQHVGWSGLIASVYNALHPPNALQAVVYPLAELAQAEDVARAGPANVQAASQQTHRQSVQQQQAAEAGLSPAVAGSEPPQPMPVAAAGDSAADGSKQGGPTEPASSSADTSAMAAAGSGAAGILRNVQQHMVHLTMLLSSRNLWMRPAVLEAPAQDPQYLEAIHKVTELRLAGTAQLLVGPPAHRAWRPANLVLPVVEAVRCT